jgi:hypothetical protein
MIKKTESIEVSNKDEEIIVVRSSFFDLPNNKQREALRLIIGWCLKHYIKILFK